MGWCGLSCVFVYRVFVYRVFNLFCFFFEFWLCDFELVLFFFGFQSFYVYKGYVLGFLKAAFKLGVFFLVGYVSNLLDYIF